MRRYSHAMAAACMVAGLLLAGCSSKTPVTTPMAPSGSGQPGGATADGPKPVFSLAWSEYPSWSVFGVADEYKLVNGKEGQLATLEKKWGVDIVLKEATYDACLNYYGSETVDAVCVTNMDALNPALSRTSVAIFPTSTSFGADACVVVDVPNVEELRKHKVYGLKGTVSEYCFVRNLELLGEKEADHKFENLDPATAALSMQNNNADQRAIMVWNPFVLQTLKSRKDAKVLFDSTAIPDEIVDMVVVAETSLKKPGGKEFAMLVFDTFYEFNKIMANSKEGDEALVDLGKKFSRLNLDEMKKAVTQTKFYKSPEEALGLMYSEQFETTMDKVIKFCVDHQIVRSPPKVAFGSAEKGAGANLRFDPSYLKEYAAAKQ